MPWRVIFPSSSSAWKALESCSSCVPCTQLDMIRGPKVCLWYKRLCLVHCLCRYPCPNCLRCPPPFGVAAFLPFFLNLHPAGLPLAFHCLLTFLPSSVTDPRLQHVPSPTWLVPMPPTPHLQTAMMTFPFCNPHVPTLPLCISDDEVLSHALGFLIFPCSHPLPLCAPGLPHTPAAVADALLGMVNIPHAYSILLLFLHLLHH
jgi:hypothetical protein